MRIPNLVVVALSDDDVGVMCPTVMLAHVVFFMSTCTFVEPNCTSAKCGTKFCLSHLRSGGDVLFFRRDGHHWESGTGGGCVVLFVSREVSVGAEAEAEAEALACECRGEVDVSTTRTVKTTFVHISKLELTAQAV